MQFIRMSALLTLLAIPGLALAHPGGLDKNGCHTDKKAGDYHCHKGPNAGKNFSSKEAMLKDTGRGTAAQPAPAVFPMNSAAFRTPSVMGKLEGCSPSCPARDR